MQNKLKYIIGLFILLTGWLILQNNWYRIFPPKSFYQEKIKSLEKNNIELFTVTKGQETVELKKEGDGWNVNGKKADKNKVETLLIGLFPTYPPDLISESESKHEELGVSKEEAIGVKLNNSLTVLIGKPTATSGLYTRFDGDNKVFVLGSLSLSDVSSSISFWADKTILAFDKQKIKNLVFRQRGLTITINKKDDKWVIENTDNEPDKDKLESILTELSSFTATSLVVEEKAKTYPGVSAFSLDIDYEGGSETLDFYQGKDDYLVKRKSGNEQFIVGNYSAEKFLEFLKV